VQRNLAGFQAQFGILKIGDKKKKGRHQAAFFIAPNLHARKGRAICVDPRHRRHCPFPSA
jgi:hypothetical protein